MTIGAPQASTTRPSRPSGRCPRHWRRPSGARGRLYDFHQLTGTADLELDRAVRLLEEAGHPEWAAKVRSEILGRNVIPGHWTFQIVEAYNATYYRPFQQLEASAVQELAQGRDHLYEAEMKEDRRTRGHPDHTARPSARES
ncbi:hypothetical protein M2163_001612 [Streptomyces sp. SAI-135]|nr:hypothetical protein [Streptomyces sp. SAI-135]